MSEAYSAVRARVTITRLAVVTASASAAIVRGHRPPPVSPRLRRHTDLEWHLIPGNHDPACPGGVWERVLRDGLPANVRIHLVAELYRQAAAGRLNLMEVRPLPESARTGGLGSNPGLPIASSLGCPAQARR